MTKKKRIIFQKPRKRIKKADGYAGSARCLINRSPENPNRKEVWDR